MASKKLSKDSQEWNFFCDFWKWIQEYYVPDKSDEYWLPLIDSYNKLYKKYEGNLLAWIMCKAFMEYTERALRGEKPPDGQKTVISITVKPKSQNEGNMDVTGVSGSKGELKDG